MKTIPFHEADIKIIDLEITHLGDIFPGTWNDILDYLDDKGYDLWYPIAEIDAVFVKKGFLDELNEL